MRSFEERNRSKVENFALHCIYLGQLHGWGRQDTTFQIRLATSLQRHFPKPQDTKAIYGI